MRTTTLILGAAVLALPPSLHAEPVRSLIEQREDGVVVQRWDLSCGAAALATLLNSRHGLDVDERSIAAQLIDRPDYLANPYIIRARHGFSLLDMKRVAARYGLVGEGFGGLDLAQLAALGPAIVRIEPHGYPHFVLVRAVRDGRVYLADPAYGQRSMTVRRFEKNWVADARYGRTAFRLARPGEPA